MNSFAKRLTNFRDKRKLSNGQLAMHLAKAIGRDVSVRTVESWIQGIRLPHTIWRSAVEEAINV